MISFNKASFIKKLDVVIDAATFQLIATTPYVLVQSINIVVPVSCLLKLADQTIEFDFGANVFLKSENGSAIFGAIDESSINVLNGSFNLSDLGRQSCYEPGDLTISSFSDATQGDGSVRVVLTYFEINP